MALVLILISNFVFISRNVHRIFKEMNKYKYEPLANPYYKLDDRHFRLQIKMDKLISEYLECNREKTCKNENNISINFNKVIFKTYNDKKNYTYNFGCIRFLLSKENNSFF